MRDCLRSGLPMGRSVEVLVVLSWEDSSPVGGTLPQVGSTSPFQWRRQAECKCASFIDSSRVRMSLRFRFLLL